MQWNGTYFAYLNHFPTFSIDSKIQIRKHSHNEQNDEEIFIKKNLRR